MRSLSKFVKDTQVPKYLLFGVCLYKGLSIYDKMKQIVAVNQVQATMTVRKGARL